MAKKKKLNRGLVLLIALAVLGALWGVLQLVPSLNTADDSVQGAETGASPVAYVLVEEDYTTVTHLSFETATVSGRYSFDGQTWTVDGEPLFPLNGTTLNSIASAVATLTASRRLDSPGSDADYGFDAPTLTVGATFGSGASYSITVGNYNRFSAAYYVKTGNGNVYLMSSTLVSLCEVSKEDMILLDEYPSDLSEDTVKKMTLSRDGKTAEITDENTVLLVMDESVSAITLDDWIAAALTPEEMEQQYEIGLHGTLTVNYDPTALDSATYCYRFGRAISSADDKATVCFSVTDGETDSVIVYTVSEEQYDALFAFLTEENQ